MDQANINMLMEEPLQMQADDLLAKNQIVQMAEPEESTDQDFPIEEKMGTAGLLESGSAKTYSMGIHKV